MGEAAEVLERIASAVDTERFGAHSVHVRLSKDQAVRHWSADVRRDVHSVAKSVCLVAAGMADDDGVFDVDAPVSRWFPGCSLGEGVDAVTVRHLLAMTSGIDLPWSETMMVDWPDLAYEFLGRPSAGRVFQYSNASTYTAMRGLASVVGDVNAWLQPRLFEPLEIPLPRWDHCPRGFVTAGGGLHLRAEELARVGQLIRDDGLWEGRQLLSKRWTEALRSDWSEHEAPAGYQRYSLGAWDGPRDAWRLHGAHGQLVIFRRNAVVTITAHDHHGADRIAHLAVQALSLTDA